MNFRLIGLVVLFASVITVRGDACSSSPCSNGATCVDLLDSYRCDCGFGYSGSTCDIRECTRPVSYALIMSGSDPISRREISTGGSIGSIPTLPDPTCTILDSPSHVRGTDIVYAECDSQLYSLNTHPSHPTLSQTLIGFATLGAGNQVVAMSIHPASGPLILYMTSLVSSTSELFTVYNISSQTTIFTNANPITNAVGSQLCWNENGTILYATTDQRLYVIDQNSGARATDLGPLTVNIETVYPERTCTGGWFVFSLKRIGVAYYTLVTCPSTGTIGGPEGPVYVMASLNVATRQLTALHATSPSHSAFSILPGFELCENGGVCNTGDQSCACASGYSGQYCTTDINECASEPCRNGGTCTDLPNALNCTCTPQRRGSTCAIRTCAACDPIASCTDLTTQVICACPIGYDTMQAGEYCQPCVAGQYSDEPGSCKDCLPGTYSNVNVTTACDTCGPRQFSSAYAATICSNCSQGEVSTFDRTACEPEPLSSSALPLSSSALPLSSSALSLLTAMPSSSALPVSTSDAPRSSSGVASASSSTGNDDAIEIVISSTTTPGQTIISASSVSLTLSIVPFILEFL